MDVLDDVEAAVRAMKPKLGATKPSEFGIAKQAKVPNNVYDAISLARLVVKSLSPSSRGGNRRIPARAGFGSEQALFPETGHARRLRKPALVVPTKTPCQIRQSNAVSTILASNTHSVA